MICHAFSLYNFITFIPVWVAWLLLMPCFMINAGFVLLLILCNCIIKEIYMFGDFLYSNELFVYSIFFCCGLATICGLFWEFALIPISLIISPKPNLIPQNNKNTCFSSLKHTSHPTPWTFYHLFFFSCFCLSLVTPHPIHS